MLRPKLPGWRIVSSDVPVNKSDDDKSVQWNSRVDSTAGGVLKHTYDDAIAPHQPSSNELRRVSSGQSL
jgi:hypothetical protein